MKKQPEIIFNELTLYQLRRTKQDIADWQKALQSAESITNPKRLKLLETYQNVLTDSFLFALFQKRILALTASPILFYNEDRTVNDDISAQLQSTWFESLIKYIGESIFYGFSLVEFDFKNFTVNLIPRTHVIPEQNKVVYEVYGSKGIDYTQPPYNFYTLFVGSQRDLGLLMQACPLVLYKRGSIGDWAQFCELFGMPIREFKYERGDEQAKLEALQAAQEAGSASYIITPSEMSLTLHNGVNGQGNDIYDKLRQAMNEELSVLILGQSMTTVNGSSRSQAEVHQNQQDMIFKSDKNFVENVLNEKVLPLFQYHGLLNEGYFAYEMKQEISIDELVKLSSIYHIPASYISDKYGIEVSDKPLTPQSLKVQKKDLVTAKQKIETLSLKNDDIDILLYLFAQDFYSILIENLVIDDTRDNEVKIFNSLQDNAFQFAAARYLFLKSEIDKAGDKASQLLSTFQNYFETEKQHFTASAQIARKWLDFEKNANEFPLIQYVTAGDDYVRPNHKAMNGITLPINDPFWQTHTPPLGYNCRCTMKQLRNNEAEITKEIPEEAAPDSSDFENNPGISGKAFLESHTYFEKTDKELVNVFSEKVKKFILNEKNKRPS